MMRYVALFLVSLTLFFAAPVAAKDAGSSSHREEVDDVVRWGGGVRITEGMVVRGDAVAFGGSVTVEPGAVVEGDAVAFGGSVEVRRDARVEGDVASFGGSIQVAEGAVVRGDSTSFGGSVEVQPGAEVRGSKVGLGLGGVTREIARNLERREPTAAERAGQTLLEILRTVARYLGVFVLGVLAIALMPRRLDRMRRPLALRPPTTILAGVLAFLAFVPLIVLLFVTVVGILLIPLLLLAYALLLFAGWIVAALVLGGRLAPSLKHSPYGELGVGMAAFLALGLMSLIPFVGWIAGLLLVVATCAGVGSVVLTRFGSEPRSSGAIHPPPEPV